ncbi:MAG TPA: hypothetical protein PLG60_01900 [Acidimicrobiales bacterium]|nr:hypothetical protein [Acidimicrobiales bacterium]
MTNEHHVINAFDAKAEIRRAIASLSATAPNSGATTSDIFIDEELTLHSIGWEPVQLVSELPIFSTPAGQ